MDPQESPPQAHQNPPLSLPDSTCGVVCTSFNAAACITTGAELRSTNVRREPTIACKFHSTIPVGAFGCAFGSSPGALGGRKCGLFCTVQPVVIFRARQPPLAGVAQGQNDGPGGQEHGPSGLGLAEVVWGINAAVSCGRPLVCCRRFGAPLAVLAL